MSATHPSLIFLVAIVILSVLEYRWRVRSGRGYDLGALGGTVGTAIGQFLSKGLTAGMTGAVFLGAYALAPVQWPLEDWRTWAACFLVLEFFYYWQHRFSHTIRWFWTSHSVHHSPNEFTLPAALRLSWTSGISGSWIVYLPMVLLGFHPLAIVTLLALNLQYQYFLHTEAVGKLGPLEAVLNTPSHHRVHHGSNAAYIDKNFGGILIIFDRLFGTFAAERTDEPVVYGLTKPLTSNNPFVIALHEWANLIREIRQAGSFNAIFHALFGRPGSTKQTSSSANRPSTPAVDELWSGTASPPKRNA